MGFAVDAVLPPGVAEARAAAVELERLGYDGLWSTETRSDPFLDLAAPAVETSRPILGTNLAIAFARSPFVTAVNAWQLQAASKGRFVLGLGTQVKGHIERRFGMPWESPGPKMREYVRALKALWKAFQREEPLNFRGKFYTHTVITPFFDPGPIDVPAPKVWIAAVNEYNAETVGLECDGILVHPVHSPKYIDDVLMPAVDKGLAKSGRRREDITVMCPVFVIAGHDAAADSLVRSQIAFYGSTRSYRRIFETHGFDDVPAKLHELMSKGDFAGMAAAITDEMLEQYAVVAEPDDVVDAIRARYAGRADRLYMYAFPGGDQGRLREIADALRA
jgi:probable F420-dependent oxidoreductase